MFEFRFYEIWRSPEYLEILFNGALTSLWLSIIGGALGFIMGLGMAMTQLQGGNRFLRTISIVYIEFVRNTPFIVQLFFVVFGLPLLLGYNWSFEAGALLAMTLNFSAYFAEVIRAGLEAVKKGQFEATQALGLTPNEGVLHVVLPQALANVWPSLSSQFVFLFLTTGLISEIGVEDLTWAGRYVADRSFRDFEVFIVLTVIYMVLVFMFLGGFQLLKRIVFPWWGKR